MTSKTQAIETANMLIDTANEIMGFNYGLWFDAVEDKDYQAASHRKHSTMAQIEGLQHAAIRCKSKVHRDADLAAVYNRAINNLQNKWAETLDW